MTEHEILVAAVVIGYIALDFFWKAGVQARLTEIERKLKK